MAFGSAPWWRSFGGGWWRLVLLWGGLPCADCWEHFHDALVVRWRSLEDSPAALRERSRGRCHRCGLWMPGCGLDREVSIRLELGCGLDRQLGSRVGGMRNVELRRWRGPWWCRLRGRVRELQVWRVPRCGQRRGVGLALSWRGQGRSGGQPRVVVLVSLGGVAVLRCRWARGVNGSVKDGDGRGQLLRRPWRVGAGRVELLLL